MWPCGAPPRRAQLSPAVVTDTHKLLKICAYIRFLLVLLLILCVEFPLPILPRAFFQDMRERHRLTRDIYSFPRTFILKIQFRACYKLQQVTIFRYISVQMATINDFQESICVIVYGKRFMRYVRYCHCK